MKGGQDDFIGCRRIYASNNEIMEQLCSLIGQQSVADYFLTARCQTALHNQKDVDFLNEELLKSLPDEKIETLFLLDLHDLVFAEWQRYQQHQNTHIHITVCYYVAWTYVRTRRFEKALEIYDKLERYFDIISCEFSIKCMRRKANCLCEIGRHEEGLQYIQSCLSKFISPSKQEGFSFSDLGRIKEFAPSNMQKEISFYALGYLKALEGDCKRHLGATEESITSYVDALANINQSKSESAYRSNLKTKCYYFLAVSQEQLQRYREAIESAQVALAVCKETHVEISLEQDCYQLLDSLRCVLLVYQAKTESMIKQQINK